MSKKLPAVAVTFETKLLKQFQRLGRHLLIGEVSLDSGYSLKVVEEQLELLEHRGAVRRLTDDEKKQIGLHDLTVAFSLVDPGKFTVVAWSDYC